MPKDRSGTQPFAALTDRGRVRPGNQDEARATALPDGAVLLLVADGLGGEPAGDLASAETAKTVEARLADGAPSPPEDLAAAFLEANRRIKALAKEAPGRATMASTLTAAVVRDGICWLANAGDSRAYLVSASGIRQLTRDDSWVAERVRAGEMTEAAAELHPYRNVVTRGVGIEDELVVEVHVHAVQPRDILLLCTDGLYRMVQDADIEALLRRREPPAALAANLLATANAAGGVDNIGVAVFVVPEPG
jgi:serine/threonine protein phosphatase PrpC